MSQGKTTLAYNQRMGKPKEREWSEAWMVGEQRRRLGKRADEGEQVVGDDRRGRLLELGFILVVAALAARLIYLQVFASQAHSLLAESNHLEQQVVVAPRGMIVDKHDAVLARGTGSGREYPLGKATAHIVGYMAEVTKAELGCSEGICYRQGGLTGRAGVERLREAVLKGLDGNKVVEVDALGKTVRELGSNPPIPGRDVKLTIDARMQEAMAEAMGERAGAVVALDMSGQVLGLYSSPAYDPSQVAEYVGDGEKQYFLDRAIGGLYPPGSVFKLVTAYAGLESGKIDGKTEIEDTGEIRIDQYRYGNWYFDQYGKTEGKLNVVRALARSNDIFFYKTGELVGVEALDKWASLMGLGKATGIELLPESRGVVPDPLGKERATGESWFLGNTYHLAIGQGDLLVTPLQVARMTAAAVSGRICGVSIFAEHQTECVGLGIDHDNLELVREGMREACAKGGTAFPFFDFDPPVLCKTGTAEHGGQKSKEDKPHAWITVAYPADNPELVLTVLLEAAGEGSYEAAPVAKEILTKWRGGDN